MVRLGAGIRIQLRDAEIESYVGGFSKHLAIYFDESGRFNGLAIGPPGLGSPVGVNISSDLFLETLEYGTKDLAGFIEPRIKRFAGFIEGQISPCP